MNIDMFMYSEWFKSEIYVSPNDNIYCLYPFDKNVKLLIMDEDMKIEKYMRIIEGIEKPKDISCGVMIYWMHSELNSEEEIHKIVKDIVSEYEANSEKFFKKYNSKDRNKEAVAMEKKEIKIVTPAEFFTKWKEMEDYWVKNDGDMDENSYYNRIINQSINIELPLLGIKTELFWCPPTVECIDELYQRMIDETYFDLLVEKEQCYYTGGGIWLAEVPFEYGDKQLVMVVDNEHTDEWAVYQNVLKDNGKWESVEYDELLVESCHSKNILPDWQIYYIRALQLLGERKG